MRKHTKRSGFTLIELIVSLGVFSVVITIAVGALLVLIANNKQLQKEQSVMTNLSFALDSMTREIRTGTLYFCESANNINQTGPKSIFNSGSTHDLDIILSTPPVPPYQDCVNGRPTGGNGILHGIAFVEGGDSITGTAERILYFYDETTGKLYRRVGTNAPESITSDGIFIRDFDLIVTGSRQLRGNPAQDDQPAVTIYIEAVEQDDPSEKVYYVQTTVTQRTLDI